MNYLMMILTILFIEYILIILHELTHFIASLFLKLKCTYIYIIPFKIYKDKGKIRISLVKFFNHKITSELHFDSLNITNKESYNNLIKKLRIYLFAGPIFDLIAFTTLFLIGIIFVEYSYLAIIALFHFAISTINFFNSDGKYAIGAKEDKRIAFDLVRNFTLCGNGNVNPATKNFLTEVHQEISSKIDYREFDVNNLWDFLNNVSFYTNSILSYFNNDIYEIDNNFIKFSRILIRDFDKIMELDYRQEEKTSILVSYYLIYNKLNKPNYEVDKVLYEKVYTGVNSPYFQGILNLYFNKKDQEIINYLRAEKNMPIEYNYKKGHSKLLYNLIDLCVNN